jgi:hypothetical protein
MFFTPSCRVVFFLFGVVALLFIIDVIPFPFGAITCAVLISSVLFFFCARWLLDLSRTTRPAPEDQEELIAHSDFSARGEDLAELVSRGEEVQ